LAVFFVGLDEGDVYALVAVKDNNLFG